MHEHKAIPRPTIGAFANAAVYKLYNEMNQVAMAKGRLSTTLHRRRIGTLPIKVSSTCKSNLNYIGRRYMTLILLFDIIFKRFFHTIGLSLSCNNLNSLLVFSNIFILWTEFTLRELMCIGNQCQICDAQ